MRKKLFTSLVCMLFISTIITITENVLAGDEENPESMVLLDAILVEPVIDFARFKDDSGIRLEVYYGLPYSAISGSHFSEDSDPFILEEKVVIKDNQLNYLTTSSTEYNLTAINPVLDKSKYFIHQKNIYFQPDSFYVALQLSEKESRLLSTKQIFIDLTNFLKNELFVSDIQISPLMLHTDVESNLNKNEVITVENVLPLKEDMQQLCKDLAENNFGDVMVVGGGISGIQASLDLATAGFKVYLVEKAPSIGGHMAQLDKTFPTNDCSM